MKKTLTATAVALFSVAPAIGFACDYDRSAEAAATPPSQLAATPAPAATKAPTSGALKAPAVKPAKQAADKTDKTREAAPDAKVAVVSLK
jgi:hypothetical protein